MMNKVLAWAAVCGLLLSGAPVLAQETPTAAPDYSSAGTPPQPSRTLSGTEVQQRALTTLAAVAAGAPELTVTPTLSSADTLVLFMRGQGLDAPAQLTRAGAVGVYQDGFYIARPQALSLDLLDLDAVQVFAGPQGAWSGRNTTGGVIALTSLAPEGQLRFRESADFANRGLFRIMASLDSPQWHGLSAKATVLVRSVDDYVKNAVSSARGYGEQRERAGRLQLRWQPVAALRADYSLQKTELDTTPAYDTNPSLNGERLYFGLPYFANPDAPTRTSYRPVTLLLSTAQPITQHLTFEWQPSAAFTLRSRTGYRALAEDGFQDYAESLGLPELTEDIYHDHQFTQDLEASGALGETLSYVAGLSYFKERGWHDRIYGFLAEFRVIQDVVLAETRSTAGFLQLHWRPRFAGERLEFTAAARYTHDVQDAERFIDDSLLGVQENGAATGALNHLSYRRINPGGVLEYHFSDGLSAYASAGSGYRAGGALEDAPAGDFAASTFHPGSLVSYELGLRGSRADSALHFEAAAFHTRQHDVQAPIQLDAVTEEIYALQQVSISGARLALEASPVRDLVLGTQLAYLHAQIDEARVARGTTLDPLSHSGSPYRVGEDVSDLFVMPYTPKYNLSAAADYLLWHGFSSDLRAHLDYLYRSGFYSDSAAGPAVIGRAFATTPATGLLNARVVYATEVDHDHHIKIGLWGNNVLDRKYFQVTSGYGSGISAFQRSAAGAEEPVGWLGRIGAWSEPATYGINFSYEY